MKAGVHYFRPSFPKNRTFCLVEEEELSGIDLEKTTTQMKYIFLYSIENKDTFETDFSYLEKFKNYCGFTDETLILEVKDEKDFISNIVPLLRKELPVSVISFGLKASNYFNPDKNNNDWYEKNNLKPVVKTLKLDSENKHEFVLYPVPPINVCFDQNPEIKKWMRYVFKFVKSLFN